MKRQKSRLYVNLALGVGCVVAGQARTANAAVLYSIDRNAVPWPELVALDTVGGTVTVIGPLNQSVTQTDLAIANGRLYAVDTNSTVDVHLLEINRQTGAVFTSCLVTFMGMPVLDAEGLAQAGGTLYIAFRDPTGSAAPSVSHAVGELQLCSSGFAVINPTTVIDYAPFFSGVDIDGMTEFPCGLTQFPGNALFAVDHDPTTTPEQHSYMTLSNTIAINGVFPDSPVTQALNDLVFCGGNLFGIDDGTKQVSLHDQTTGAILTYLMSYSAQSSLTGLAGGECCVAAPADMVAWWPLDEITGSTALDIVGGNHGMHIGGPAPLVGELVDNSLCFDGVSQYVNVPTAGPLNLGATAGSDFTIDAWVRADTVTGVFPIVDKRSGVPQGYQLFVFNGRLGFQMADAIGNNCNCGAPNSVCGNYIAPTADITVGVWHHVAVTVLRSGGPTGELYVDGNSVHSFTPRGGPLANSASLWIGRAHTNPCGATAYWNGCIDEVEFFDRVLSIDEIVLLHDACRGGKCKLCSAIDEFCADLQDDCTGSSLPDSTCLPKSVIIQMGQPPVVEECDCCEPGCCRGIQITQVADDFDLTCEPVDCPPPQGGFCQIHIDGVAQGVSNVNSSSFADGSRVTCDCPQPEQCPLPDPEPTPSCAQQQATDCDFDDVGLTCLPTVIQLVDDGAGGLVPVAEECDCTDCYAVYTAGMVPPVECVGTCPADKMCTLVAFDTDDPPDGVDDWFECHCFVDCCLPDGTCITTTADDCLAQSGTQVPDCLGDSNFNGIDDACECGLVDDSAAEPTCAGVCPGPLPPVTECVPRCVNYNPQTGQSTVTDCDCRETDECRVEYAGVPTPGCVGNCLVPGETCVETQTVLNDNTIDICCDCLPQTPCANNGECNDFDPCTFNLCINGVCTNEESRYGDVAGFEGACGPNDNVDLLDIIAVLNGFGGRFADGCEPANLDIAGAQGSCVPNGIIDLSDIIAVLDAFQGLDNCCANGR